MTGFNLALAATAELLAKLTHLDRMPGGGGALDGLQIEIDGSDEALRITWAKPDAARKAAAYTAELREAMASVRARAPALDIAPFPTSAPPPAHPPTPLGGPESSDPPSQPVAAAGEPPEGKPLSGFVFTPKANVEIVDLPPATVDSVEPAVSDPPPSLLRAAAGNATETTSEDNEVPGEALYRIPPAPPPCDPPELPADSNRGRVLAAWREGGRDVAVIARQTGLESQQVIMALKGLRSLGLVPKASEIRAVERPGCRRLEGETPIDAAIRLRAEGYGWGAIAKACGYRSADVASVMVNRHKAKQLAEASAREPVTLEPAKAPAPARPDPELRKAAVDVVLNRIGLGEADQASTNAGGAAQIAVEAAQLWVADAGQQDAPAIDGASAVVPVASTEPVDSDWDNSILIVVSERDDGRFDVRGPRGVHIASPAVGRLIAKLSEGSLYGAEVLAVAAGVKPPEVPSLQSAVRLVCNRVGRQLVVVKGIGWRIAQ